MILKGDILLYLACRGFLTSHQIAPHSDFGVAFQVPCCTWKSEQFCAPTVCLTKPINVKSWEHDPQSNLSLFAKFGAQPSLMPCPVARFGYPQISAHAKWFDITTKHATGHGGWATSVSTMPQLSYQCCARTQVLLKFPTWWEHLSDVDAVDGCWGYSQSIILVEPCCTRLRRPWWGA